MTAKRQREGLAPAVPVRAGQAAALRHACAVIALLLCACSTNGRGGQGNGVDLNGADTLPPGQFPVGGAGGAMPAAFAGSGGVGGAPAAPVAGSAGGGFPSGGSTGGLDASTSTLDAAQPRDASLAADSDAQASDAGDAGMADASVPVHILQASEFHGVNWADTRDNFVNGLLQLSGLNSSTDSYDSVQAKTSQIAAEFRDKLGANAIRIPINEPTVASPWWDAYKAVIDTTTGMGMHVIVAYWAYRNGKPDDEAAFKAMWQTVVTDYADNDRVYFDIHNEPSGYGSSWNDEAARWLGYFPQLPRARVIVAGTGSDDNVVNVGSDSRFEGCLLELHYYAFWYKDWTTQKQWRDGVNRSLGTYASRTIVGEWGATMSSGLDYDTSTPDGNNEISYITAMADLMRENDMGSVYWPGLRDADTYAMMKRATSGSSMTLSVVNESGRNQLRWAWNL